MLPDAEFFEVADGGGILVVWGCGIVVLWYCGIVPPSPIGFGGRRGQRGFLWFYGIVAYWRLYFRTSLAMWFLISGQEVSENIVGIGSRSASSK